MSNNIKDYLSSKRSSFSSKLQVIWGESARIHDKQSSVNSNINGFSHVDRVEKNIWKLLRDSDKLSDFNDVELFILSCCCCMHDFDKGLQRADTKGKMHGEGSGSFIVKHCERFFLPQHQASLISEIVGVHDLLGESFQRAITKMRDKVSIEIESVKLRQLAVLFKAGDILHTDFSRVDDLGTDINELSESDKKKYLARNSISGWDTNGNEIVIDALCASDEQFEAVSGCEAFMRDTEWPCVANHFSMLGFPSVLRFNIENKKKRPKDHSESKQKKDDIEELHEISLNRHLPKYFRKRPKDIELFTECYSEVFKLISLSSITDTTNNYIKSIASSIESSDAVYPLMITGEVGTGKTTLLSCIYHYFLHNFCNKSSQLIPVYINIHKYSYSKLDNDEEKAISTIKLQLRKDLSRIITYSSGNKSSQFLILLDSIGESQKIDKAIREFVIDYLSPVKHKKVVGLELDVCDEIESSVYPLEFQESIKLQRLFINDNDEKYNEFLESYFLASGVTDDTKKIAIGNIIKGSYISEVDMFLMYILTHYFKQTTATKKIEITDIYKLYIKNRVLKHVSSDKHEEIIRKSAEIAFNLLVRRKEEGGNIKEKAVINRVVRRHPHFTDYLAALHVINTIFEPCSKKKSDKINFVYPYSINRYCKVLINSKHKKDSKSFLSILPELLSVQDITFKADICYLAGRVEDPQEQIEIRNLLRDEKDKLHCRTKELRDKFECIHVDTSTLKEFKKYLLCLRTIYISLTKLGDKDSEKSYVESLLSNQYYDMCNRGFHLEYYGDQDYNPKLPLLNADLLKDFSKTYNKLKREISKNPNNKLFQLQIYTLASLTNHRLVNGKLSDSVKQDIKELLDVTIKNKTIKIEKVELFIKEVIANLNEPKFLLWDKILKLLTLQDIKRTGWLKRGIPPEKCESVADHTLTAYHIALIFLPKKLNLKEYNKQRILDMLAIHDIGEVIVGDILSDEKTTPHKIAESRACKKISFLGSFPQTESLHSISELFDEFSIKDSENAKLAYDFDKFQTLIKIYQYKLSYVDYQHDKFEDIEKDMRSKIKTDFVRSLLDSFDKYTCNQENQWDIFHQTKFGEFCELT